MNKSDQIIWYIMTSAIGIIIIGGGAWAHSINEKVDKIAALEVNIQYIQTDISSIKNMIQSWIKRGL